MPRYSYQAVNRDGKTARGALAAGSLAEAAAVLRGQGLVITGIKEQEQKEQKRREAAKTAAAPAVNLNDLLIKLGRVKQSEVVILLWQMAALIAAGVSIVTSLAVLEEQSSNRRLKFILASVRRDVESGKSLSDAMIKFPKTFPAMVTSILKTGESSGLLDTAMERIATYWEERLELLRKIISSLLYPVIVLVVALAVIVFMVSYVLPQVVPLLESLGSEMPWTTKFLVSLADHASGNLDKLGLGLGGLVLMVAVFYYLPAGRYFIDRYKTRLPLLGPIFQYTVVVHFAKTLSLLVGSGVSILDALRATNDTIGNTAVRRVVDRMADRVLRGENLSDPLLKAGNYFPPMVGNMVRVGEETGSVDSSLVMVADIYAKLLQSRIDKMISLIEPILLVGLGGMVGFIAAAMIGAIVSSYGSVQ